MRANKFKIVWLLTQTTRTNSKKLRLNGIVAMSIDKLLSKFKDLIYCRIQNNVRLHLNVTFDTVKNIPLCFDPSRTKV